MQEILVQWFGESGASAARYVIALVVVVALLLVLRWVMQRYMTGSGLRLGRGRQQRLAVMDATVVDARRRLVLVRRDNVEHLLLIGGPTDIVVEQTIIRRMPVGTAGWMPQRAAEPAPAEVAEKVSKPAEPAISAPAPKPEMAQPIAHRIETRPEPLPEPVVPVRPIESRPRIVEPAPVEMPRPVEVIPLRPVPVPEPAPYVPPAPSRPEPHIEAIEPIVPPKPAAAAVAIKPVEAPPAEDFDDLARRLDEALRIDIEEESPAVKPTPSFGRPSRGPAARASAPVEPKVEPVVAEIPEPEVVQAPPAPEPAPAAKPAPTVMSNSWFRPRPAKSADAPKPAAPVIAPVLPPIAPVNTDAELSAALADDLARIVGKPAPAVEIAPAPKVEPVAAAPRIDAPKTSEFSSLEDEMARLLDELSGDKTGG